MGKQLQWETDFSQALSKAKTEKKIVIVDFFNPG
jgi:hypothetical protein